MFGPCHADTISLVQPLIGKDFVRCAFGQNIAVMQKEYPVAVTLRQRQIVKHNYDAMILLRHLGKNIENLQLVVWIKCSNRLIRQ